MSQYIKRGISYVIGLFILSLGISFTIKSGLGAGAWDALAVGLSGMTGFTVGTWVILIGVILIFVNAILGKSKPQYISIITVLITGYFIDFWLIIVLPNFSVATLLFQFTVLLSGVVLMGIGIATYLQGRFAVIPIDGFMLAIQKRLKVNLMISKTIGEIVALILAFIVGGPIGIGTITVTLFIGPMIQTLFPYLERAVHG